MPNSRFFVGFCLVLGACLVLLSCELPNTGCLLMATDSNKTPHELSTSVTKSAMFEPRHHGHKLFKPRHQGHRMSAIRNEHMYDKVLVSQRRNDRHPEKEQKEPMAKEEMHNSRSQSDATSVTENSASVNSSNMVYSTPIWDIHGASQQAYHKIFKHRMVEKEESRHRSKKNNEEDFYYTFDAEFEVRTRSASSKITHFLKESIGWVSENESDEAPESFLRGGNTDPNEE